jgi:hypothetical protein
MPIATNNILLVLTRPLPGREEEYHRWYTDVHLAEVLARPGFVSARRFELTGGLDVPDFARSEHRYLALYEVEGDAEAAYAYVTREILAGELAVTEALDPDVITGGFTAITETMTKRVSAQAAADS